MNKRGPDHRHRVPTAARTDLPFLGTMWGLGGSYVLLIVLLLAANLMRTTPRHFVEALAKPEIQAAILLTLKSCTLSAILSIWIGLPLAYLLSRQYFPGRAIIDTIVDIPLILPPLVLGLSLLLLFHLPIGDWQLEGWLRRDLKFPVTYFVPSVILAQFVVSAAFAIRTLRVTFDRIDPRAEDVARTLGCNRRQAFFQVCLPQAIPGVIAAFTLAWARAMGEFGPILVFSGTTPFRTEVLSTAVYLELGIGNLEAAVAVSLLMVGLSLVILLMLRLLGTGERR
ncbi:ABC transporter permease [Planctomicrobium sp. SH661]|uniref:ABC transporter permease n=1 Tax=Planctomicrobium sp. SH661 TaxID=3448124 RepID=UPI003F5BF4DF